MLSFNSKKAEVDFCIPYSIGNDEEKFLQGQMDLVCTNDNLNFTVYDYKTGAQLGDLKKKHYLQAKCYSDALLYYGAKSVTVKFICVELHLDINFQF